MLPAVAVDGTLTYTPFRGRSGLATVTVTCHDNGGLENGGQDSSEPQSFRIGIGDGLTIGSGAGDYDRIHYTDSDGTNVTITQAGIRALVHFAGDDVRQTARGRTLYVTDRNGRVEVAGIEVLASNAQSRLSISADRGGHALVRVGSIRGGRLGTLDGPGAVLAGEDNALESLNRLNVAGLDGATLRVSDALDNLSVGWMSASSIEAGRAGQWTIQGSMIDSSLEAASGTARLFVRGSVLGSRLSFDRIRSVRIQGDMRETHSGGSLLRAREIALFDIDGLLGGSTIAVGVDAGSGGFFDGDETPRGGVLGRATIGGIVRGGDLPFGIVADAIGHSVRVGRTFIRPDALPWSDGQFRIVVV